MNSQDIHLLSLTHTIRATTPFGSAIFGRIIKGRAVCSSHRFTKQTQQTTLMWQVPLALQKIKPPIGHLRFSERNAEVTTICKRKA